MGPRLARPAPPTRLGKRRHRAAPARTLGHSSSPSTPRACAPTWTCRPCWTRWSPRGGATRDRPAARRARRDLSTRQPLVRPRARCGSAAYRRSTPTSTCACTPTTPTTTVGLPRRGVRVGAALPLRYSFRLAGGMPRFGHRRDRTQLRLLRRTTLHVAVFDFTEESFDPESLRRAVHAAYGRWDRRDRGRARASWARTSRRTRPVGAGPPRLYERALA